MFTDIPTLSVSMPVAGGPHNNLSISTELAANGLIVNVNSGQSYKRYVYVGTPEQIIAELEATLGLGAFFVV